MSAASPTRDLTSLSTPTWLDALALPVWLAACVVAFLPFAFNTSPWDAVRLHVPENQGNWWHALVGAPFFLAYPMVWLRVRALLSRQPTLIGSRVLWTAIGLSICGTVAVETPFLRHLAGTSEWQRLIVLGLGLGVVIASVTLLLTRRRSMSPASAHLIGLDTAWLANASVCLIVYADATGTLWSRSGWVVTAVIVWPILLELVWLSARSLHSQPVSLRQ